MAGFYRIWRPNFGLIAKPLYEATRGPDNSPLDCTGETKKAFNNLKQALTQAPALGIPDLTKPFTLYIAERRGTALGVITQRLGSEPRPVAYFSKILDGTTLGWPRFLSCSCNSPISRQGHQNYSRTATRSTNPPSGQVHSRDQGTSMDD